MNGGQKPATFFGCPSSRRSRLRLFAGSEGEACGGGGVWSAATATATTSTWTRRRVTARWRGKGEKVSAWNAIAGGA